MQRFIERAIRRGGLPRGRLTALGVAAALLALSALPADAPAATQALKVEKAGTGTGTVTSSPAGIECGGTCSASFAEGATVVLKAVSGANTAGVEWKGCSQENLEHECKVTMSAAKTVTATFNLLERTLKVTKEGTGTGTVTSSPAGIECGATCSASFVKGTTVTLAGAAGAGSEPVAWSGCDSTPEGKCVVTMSAVKSVTATFNLPSFQLSVSKAGSGTGTVKSSPGGIECGFTCAANFVKGTTVTLVGTPGLHSKAVKWLGCDGETLEGKCLVPMNGARSVTATFDLEPQWTEYPITLQKVGTGQGTVTSSPGGIECGPDCSQAYLYGTHLTLTATPASGSEFVKWVGGTCSGRTGACVSTVNRSRRLKAAFVAVGTRTLTVSKAGTGQGTVTSKPAAIDCGSVCSAEIGASTKVTLTATATTGSKFVGWSGACSAKATCKVLMNEARKVTASFEKVGGPSPGVLSIASAKAKGSKALLRVSCKGGACNGTLKLVVKIRNAQGQVKGLVIAKVSYSLAAGASSVLEARLSPRGLSLLRSQGRLRVRAIGGGVQGRSLRLAR